MERVTAKTALLGGFVLVAVVAVGFGVSTRKLPPSRAVGCPPPQGPVTNIPCGGSPGAGCPGNLVCVDDPEDDCCPDLGGRDCPEVCARG